MMARRDAGPWDDGTMARWEGSRKTVATSHLEIEDRRISSNAETSPVPTSSGAQAVLESLQSLRWHIHTVLTGIARWMRLTHTGSQRV